MLLAFAPLAMQAQFTATFGTGNSATSTGGAAGAPMSYGGAYSWCQQIYRAAEFTAAGVPAGALITSISFNNATGATTMSDLRTYMGHCTNDYFASTTSWVPYNTLMLVDSGDWVTTDTGWFEIQLDQPFVWDGTSNVVVGVSFRGAHSDYNTNNPNCGYRYTTQGGSAHIRRFSTTLSSCDPTSTAAASSTSTARPNLRISYVVSGCASLSPNVANIGPYTADLNWVNFQQAVSSWDIMYGVHGTFDTLSGGTTVSSITDTFYTLSGLTSATTYAVYMKPYCSSETGSWSAPRTFTTTAACPTPTNLIVQSHTASEVTISWQPGATETGWEVACVPHGAPVASVTPNYVTNIPYTYSNLIDDTQYDIYVRADCGNGENSYWTSATFTTDPLCTAPRNVTVSQVVGTSALVSWQAALVGALDYTVEYSEAGQNVWNTTIASGTSTMLSGLTPQTSYQVRVFSNCTLGDADTIYKSFTTGCLSGGDYAVGTGTLTTYELPINNYWEYSYTQQIFLASEMNGPQSISSVAFQYAYSSPSTVKNSVNIYMGHTTQSTFASETNYISSSNLTLVYSGNLNCQQGWNTFNLTTPFQYNGTDNLVLVVDDNSGDYNSDSYTFYAHDAGANRAVHYYQDGADISMSSPTSADYYDVTNYRSNVKFGGQCNSTATCIAPNVYISDVTDESITVNWVPGYTESSWNLEYKAGSGAWVSEGTVTGSTYIINNLTSNTNYTIRMQSDCGGGDVSDWTMATTKTACSFETIPYSENFDNAPGTGSGNMVDCWTRNTNYTSTAYPYTSSSYHHSGNYSVYFYGTSAYYSYIASPRFDDQVLMNNLQISFWAYKTSANYQIEVGIMSDPDDISTFVSLGQVSPSATSTWQKFEVNTNFYAGTGHHIAFRMPANITSYMYIDDIDVYEIPSCDHVINVHAVNVTPTTADVAWTPRGTETQWNVVYGVQGTITDPSLETPTVVYTPSISLTGLMASTHYDVYVQADCGSETSVWEHNTITTACGLIDQLPLIENFDSYTGGSSSNNVMPLCWSHLNTGTTSTGYPTVYSGSSTYFSSGAKGLYFYSSSSTSYGDQYAILPQLDVTTIPINTLRLSFKARRYTTTATYVNTIIVGVMTNPASASTFEPVDTVTLTSTTIGTHYVDFTNYTGTGSYLAIMVPRPDGTTFTYNYNYIDDVTLDVAPACSNPTGLHVSNITTTGANVSWSAGGSESEWEMVLVPGNAPISTGIPTSLYTNAETLANLTSGTDYTLYLRAVCPQGGYSEYISTSFATQCEDIQTLPFTCNFDNVTGATTTSVSVNNLPVCWGHHSGTNSSYSGYPIVYSSSSYAASGSNAMRFYTYTSTSSDYGNQYAVLPPIDVTLYPLNTLQLTMDVRKNSTSYTSFTLIVGVMTDPNDVSTFVPVETIVEPTTTYNNYTVFFGNYTGTGKYIAMYAPMQGQSGVTYNTGYVDNIVVEPIPACPPVTNLSVSNVSGTSALLSWDEGVAGMSTDFVVEYSEHNQNNWTTESGVTASPYFLSGLNPQTHYDVRVKANCGSDESIWRTEEFTTPCLVGGEFTIGNGTTTNTYFPSYSTYMNGYSQQIFLASEMNGADVITSVSFEMTAVGQQRNFKIYLMHTTQSTSSTWIPANNAQLCFQGAHNFVVGWNTFNFTTPFQYNGTDNLVLIVIDENSTWTSGNTFTVHTVPSNTSHLWYSDSYTYSTTSAPNSSSSEYSTTTYRNNVKFGGQCDNTATCVAPNVIVTAIDQTSATVMWAPGLMESYWNLEYKASSDANWTSVPGVTGSTYTITGLNAATHYEVRMQSDCGGGDVSSWASADFYTQCGLLSVPFTENFDGYSGSTSTTMSTSNLPLCWNNLSGSYSSYAGYPIIYSSSSYAASGTNALRFYTYTGTTDYGDQYAILPAIDVSTYPLNSLQISMDVRKNSTSYSEFTLIVGVMSDPANAYSFVPVDTIVETGTSYVEHIAYFNNYMGNGSYIALKAPRQTTSSYNTGYVDNIVVDVIPTCPKPVSLHAVSSTTNTITLGWHEAGTATAWNIEYGPTGFTQGSGTVVTAYSNPFTITGLVPSTLYDMYVQSDCGGGDESDFSTRYTAATSCALVSVLPLTENFDNYPAGSSSSNVMPICWSHLNTGTTSTGYPTIYSSSSTYFSSGVQGLYFYSSSSTSYGDQYAILPQVDVTALPINTLRLSFKARRYSTTTSYVNTIIVGVMTNPTSASSFVPVDTVTLTSTTISTHHVDFTNYTGSGSYIAIMVPRPDGTTFTTNYNYIDDVTLDVAPACSNPSNLQVSNITTTGATVSWTAGSTESEWEMVLVQGTAPVSTGTTYNVYTTTETLANLTSGTDYTVYLRAVCPQGGYSEYITTTFATQCEDIQTLPFTCNFDNVTGTTSTSVSVNNLPVCWGYHSGTNSSYSGYPIVYNSSSYAASGSNSMRFYTYTSTSSDYGNQYAILPPIDVTLNPINTLQMSLDVRKNSTSYTSFTLIVGVMTDPTDLTTFTPVQTIVQTETTYSNYVVYFGNYTGTGKYIAMYAPMQGQSGVTYNTGYVDNIVVEPIPACPPVMNFSVSNVTGTSALLTWDEGVAGMSNDFVVEYTEYNQNNWVTMSGVTGSPYFLTGLNPLTHYQVRVKANCGTDESAWRTDEFTTPCLAGGEFTIGNGNTTNSYLPSYSTYKNGYSQQIFLASEMNGPSVITSVSFEMTAVGQQRNFKIYLMHTTQSTASAWIPANNAQLCFQGAHNFVVGWNTFNFTTPFQYNGTDNLVLIVIDENSTWTSGNSFTVHTVPSNTSHLWYSDSYTYSITSAPNSGSSEYSTTTYRNNVKFGGQCDNTVTCIAPNMIVTSVDQTSATVMWAPGNMESSWNLEYKASSDTTWTTVPGVTGSTYTITGLNAATHYDVRMQSDCGGGDVSTWVSTTFITDCGDITTLPYTENFDTYGTGESAYPLCWSKINTYSSNRPYINATNYNGVGSLYFYAGTSGTYNIAVTPPFDANINITGLQAVFMYRALYASDRLIVGVMSNPSDASTFVSVDTIYPEPTASTWAERTVYFNNYTGNGNYIAFKNDYTTTSSYAYIDNLEIDVIPTCPKPASLNATAVTTTSITLGWNDPASASSWNIEYGLAGFTQGTGTVVVANTNPYTITGLTANTNYTFYVQSDCGGGDLSNFSAAYSARTDCDVTSTLPYTENFDTYGTGESAYPNCWRKINTYSSIRPYVSPTSYAGGGSLYFYAGTSGTYNIAVAPELDASINISDLQAVFMYRATYASDRLIVGVMSNPMDASTFVPVETISPASTASTWVEKTVYFNNYTGNGHYIAFKNEYTTTYSYAYIDNLVIDVAPTCPKPHSLTCSSLTDNTATFTWTESGTATAWEIEYGPAGFVHGNGTTVQVTTNPYTVTGLTASTTYDFYVRAICSATDQSVWEGPVSVTPGSYNMLVTGSNTITTCNMVIYDDGGPNGDYSMNCNSTLTINPATPGAVIVLTGTCSVESSYDYLYVYDGTSTSGTLLATYNNTNQTVNCTSTTGPLTLYFTSDGSVVYPGFALTATCSGGSAIVDPTVTTQAADNIGTTSATLHGTVTAGSETITAQGFEWKTTTGGSYTAVNVAGTTMSHNLTGLTPNTGYTFRAFATTASGTTYGTALTFTTQAEQQTCPSPTNVQATNITENSAVISWTQPDNTANSWDVLYKMSAADSWYTVSTTTNPYTLVGLTGSTSYDVQVIAHCTNGQTSDPSATITFMTTGINDYTLDNTVTVYPNPTTGLIQIENGEWRMENVEVYDAYGKLLNTMIVNDHTANLDLSGYAKGTYFVRVTTEKGVVTKRVVKN